MRVRKLFPGFGYYTGRVLSLCGANRCKVKYDDGDVEEVDTSEALKLQVKHKHGHKNAKHAAPALSSAGLPWTNADDKRLFRLIKSHGAENWQVLANAFNSCKSITPRTASGLRRRYSALQTKVEPANPWTDSEDMRLLTIMEGKSDQTWDDMAQLFNAHQSFTRTSGALRQRFSVLRQRSSADQSMQPNNAAGAIASCWDCEQCSICRDTFADVARDNPERRLVYFDCQHIHCEECLLKWWATDSSPAKKNSCPECQRVYPGMRRCSLVRAADFACSQMKKKQIAEKDAREAAAKLQAKQPAAATAARLKTATKKKKLLPKQSASTGTASASSSDSNPKTALTSWTKEDTDCLRQGSKHVARKTKANAFRNSRGINLSVDTLQKHTKAITSGDVATQAEKSMDGTGMRATTHLGCSDCEQWFSTAELGVTDEYCDTLGNNDWYCPVCAIKPENTIQATKSRKPYNRMASSDSAIARDILNQYLAAETGPNANINYKLISPEKQQTLVKLVNDEFVRLGRQPIYSLQRLHNWSKNAAYKETIRARGTFPESWTRKTLVGIQMLSPVCSMSTFDLPRMCVTSNIDTTPCRNSQQKSDT